MNLRWCIPALAGLALGGSAQAQVVSGESPRSVALEVKLGGYKPLIDREASLTGRPYDETFGAGAMLLFEIEGDRQLWQRVGSLGIGFSLGYAEKYAAARVGEDPSGAPKSEASESTGFKVVPIKLLGVYRFDYGALHFNIPLVPYVKLGLAYTVWWSTKGGQMEFVDGLRAAGGKWGYAGVAGLSLLLDFFEPRLARDFDSDVGVNHSYLFAEYVRQEVNDFGQCVLDLSSQHCQGGLDLSSQHWMFGLTLEY